MDLVNPGHFTRFLREIRSILALMPEILLVRWKRSRSKDRNHQPTSKVLIVPRDERLDGGVQTVRLLRDYRITKRRSMQIMAGAY